MAQSERAMRSSSEVRSPAWRVVQPQQTSTAAADEPAGGGSAEVLADAARHGGASDSWSWRVSTRNCVPPMRGQHVVLAERHRQGAGDGLQRGVTGLMAEALVELLHVADVDEEACTGAFWRSANCRSCVPRR